jgi:hypothetical protein
LGVGVVVQGDTDDVEVGQYSLQASSRFNTPEPRHVHVHNYHLRGQRQGHLQGDLSIASFPDNREARMPVQNLAERGAEWRKVINQQNRTGNRTHPC